MTRRVYSRCVFAARTWLPALLGIALVTGCSHEYPVNLHYSFSPHPNKNGQNEKELVGESLNASERHDIAKDLEAYFGTPRHPRVDMDAALQKELLLTDTLLEHDANRDVEEVLAEGSRLYRQHCLYCHGLSGDASGPTGQFLNPLPRDFRQGKFKFRSTAKKSGDAYETTQLSLPSRADLRKTIRNGVPTASMPSFTLLPEDQLDALVSYVIHLSLRGQVEYQFAREGPSGNVNIEEELARAADKWAKDNRSQYVPPEPPKKLSWVSSVSATESWDRGRKVYLGPGGCVQCHGKDGRSSVSEVAENEARKNDWGDLIMPRNLTLGAYRGGSRPLDLYYRIKLGIPVSAMPAANPKEVSDEDLWYLVDYVMSLPRLPGRGSKAESVADVGGLSK